LIADSGVASDAIQELARSERDVIFRKSIGSFYHDELEVNFNPIYFHEFASFASVHDLQFIFEAVYNEGQVPLQLTDEANGLLEQAATRGVLVHEQYQDFLKLRRFRQSLVTHSSVAIDREAPPRMMHKFHFAAPLQRTAVPEGVEFSNPQTKAAVVTPNPITISALDRIGKAWPSTVAFDQLTDDPGQREGLEPVLERFFAAGLIDAHATPRICLQQPGTHPEVWKYARWQAQNHERVLTPMTLAGVAVEDENIRKLVLLADGTRSVDELAAAIGDRTGVERSLVGAARMGFLVPPGSGLQ
jgi:methyltransferase-like protein